MFELLVIEFSRGNSPLAVERRNPAVINICAISTSKEMIKAIILQLLLDCANTRTMPMFLLRVSSIYILLAFIWLLLDTLYLLLPRLNR